MYGIVSTTAEDDNNIDQVELQEQEQQQVKEWSRKIKNDNILNVPSLFIVLLLTIITISTITIAFNTTNQLGQQQQQQQENFLRTTSSSSSMSSSSLSSKVPRSPLDILRLSFPNLPNDWILVQRLRRYGTDYDVGGGIGNSNAYSQYYFGGTIPTEIGLLTHLAGFTLQSNDYTGTMPTEFGLLPFMDSLTICKCTLLIVGACEFDIASSKLVHRCLPQQLSVGTQYVSQSKARGVDDDDDDCDV